MDQMRRFLRLGIKVEAEPTTIAVELNFACQNCILKMHFLFKNDNFVTFKLSFFKNIIK